MWEPFLNTKAKKKFTKEKINRFDLSNILELAYFMKIKRQMTGIACKKICDHRNVVYLEKA
jgi:hypothetical protein